jgi:hypothetical protein
MTITVYRSTDASAPVLTGQAGSLITLFDAVLVNGYGSKAAAGWTKPYSGTNKAAYRLGAGTQFYMRVDDIGTTSAAYGRVLGYESMSDVDTGTNGFPTNVQVGGGLYAHKSSTADSTARPWMIIACDRALYFFGQCAQTTFGATPASTDNQWFFGDIKSYKSGDAYQCAIVASISATLSSATQLGHSAATSSQSTTSGHYIARAYTQTGGATGAAKSSFRSGFFTSSGGAIGTNTLGQYPNPITGSLDMSPLMLCEIGSGGSMLNRGQFPGLYEPQHSLPGTAYDTFSGTGALAGITFMLVPVFAASTIGRGCFQTSGTWY